MADAASVALDAEVRSFMTPDKIKLWLNPVKRQATKPIESTLIALDKMATAQVQPKAPVQAPETVYYDDEAEDTGTL